MYSKYLIIVRQIDSDKPFVTFLEFEDANEAIETYEEFVSDDVYDVVMYRRFKHDYVSI